MRGRIDRDSMKYARAASCEVEVQLLVLGGTDRVPFSWRAKIIKISSGSPV